MVGAHQNLNGLRDWNRKEIFPSSQRLLYDCPTEMMMMMMIIIIIIIIAGER